MRKPYDRPGVDFGWCITFPTKRGRMLMGSPRRSPQECIKEYNRHFTEPGQYQRDRKRDGLKIEKVETRIVAEWSKPDWILEARRAHIKDLRKQIEARVKKSIENAITELIEGLK